MPWRGVESFRVGQKPAAYREQPQQGGSSRFTGGQIPRMRIPNFEVTGQKKWERMEAGGGRWRHVEGKLRPKSNFFSGTKYFFRHKIFLFRQKILLFRHKIFFLRHKIFLLKHKIFLQAQNVGASQIFTSFHTLDMYNYQFNCSRKSYNLKTPPPSPLLTFSMQVKTLV